jgi:hypothetical protein
MNSVMTLALVVLFPVACLLTLLGLSWLEDSLDRSIEGDAKPALGPVAASPVVEMAVRRTEPVAEAPATRARLQPSRAAS